MQCIVVDALNSSSSCLRVGICLWVKLTDTLRSLVLLQFPTAVTTSNNVCLKSHRLNVPHGDKSSCPPETSQRDCNRIGKYYHTHPRAVSGQESRRCWRTTQELSKSDCVEIYVNTHLDWALRVGGVPSSALPLVLQRR